VTRNLEPESIRVSKGKGRASPVITLVRAY
jgi:hypothetical protein